MPQYGTTEITDRLALAPPVGAKEQAVVCAVTLKGEREPLWRQDAERLRAALDEALR